MPLILYRFKPNIAPFVAHASCVRRVSFLEDPSSGNRDKAHKAHCCPSKVSLSIERLQLKWHRLYCLRCECHYYVYVFDTAHVVGLTFWRRIFFSNI